jgi:hypothetical protein
LEEDKKRRILLLLSKSTEVKNSQLLPFDDDYDDDDNKKMTAIISSPRELENVNEIEAPGMKQITTRTQSQMTRQLEGDDSTGNGGGRSRKQPRKKEPEILDPSADIFSEARHRNDPSSTLHIIQIFQQRNIGQHAKVRSKRQQPCCCSR